MWGLIQFQSAKTFATYLGVSPFCHVLRKKIENPHSDKSIKVKQKKQKNIFYTKNILKCEKEAKKLLLHTVHAYKIKTFCFQKTSNSLKIGCYKSF